jgi:hypothetical protein
VSDLLALLRSPIGPTIVLLIGAFVVSLAGRIIRRPVYLTALALIFIGVAFGFWLDLRFQAIVPVFSRGWRPLFQTGANLLWVGDGWNWYASGLMLLMGALAMVLDLDEPRRARQSAQQGLSLGVNLAIVGAAVLFVSSGNLLTVVLTWVLLDVMVLVRGVTRPTLAQETGTLMRWYSNTRGLSLVGAVLLLMSLLPAGPTGPDQALQGGVLPFETLLLLIAAALLRIGVYPVHFWLLPDRGDQIDISERLLDHVAPVLTGMWLLGWSISLGGQEILQTTEMITFLTFGLLIAAFAAFITRDLVTHTTFVLVAAAGQCVLAGALFYSDSNPAAMLWSVTTFSLGGAMWLVGRRIWQVWGWQLPVSVGALTLAGAPFTPGFLMQPSFASLLGDGALSLLFFGVYVVGQGFLIAALLRSWGGNEARQLDLPPAVVFRLLIAAVAIAIPLALAGFLPGILSAISGIPGAIPPQMGTPPSVVAEPQVWIPLTLSLGVGLALIFLLPRLPQRLMITLGQLGAFLRLDWLYQGASWGMGEFSRRWGAGFGVIEGAGYIGWMLALVLLAYLLIV